MNSSDSMVTSSVVNDLSINNAEFVVFVVILCPLKVRSQT